MRVNNCCANFFETAKFDQLSCLRKFAVVIVAILPIVTLAGIIAAPFIWRGMVKMLSKKKITKIETQSAVSVIATGSKGIIFKLTSKPLPSSDNHDSRHKLAGELENDKIKRTNNEAQDFRSSSDEESDDAATLESLSDDRDKIKPRSMVDSLSDDSSDEEDSDEALVGEIAIKDSSIVDSLSEESRDDAKGDYPAIGSKQIRLPDDSLKKKCSDDVGKSTKSGFSKDKAKKIDKGVKRSNETLKSIKPLLTKEEIESQLDQLTSYGIPILHHSHIILPSQLKDGDFLLHRDGDTFFLTYNRGGEVIEGVQFKPGQDILLRLTKLQLWPTLRFLRETTNDTLKTIENLEKEIAILEEEVEKNTKEEAGIALAEKIPGPIGEFMERFHSAKKEEKEAARPVKVDDLPKQETKEEIDRVAKREKDIEFIKAQKKFFEEGQKTPALRNGEYYVVNLTNGLLLLKYRTTTKGVKGSKSISMDKDLMKEIQDLKKLW